MLAAGSRIECSFLGATERGAITQIHSHELVSVQLDSGCGTLKSLDECTPIVTLVDVLPPEFTQGEYHDKPAFKHGHRKVVAKYSTLTDRDGTRIWKPWPGRERNVQNWYVLDNGRAVGWNEGPQGWSFPVISYKEHPNGS